MRDAAPDSISAYDFTLPERLIARYPAERRDQSRLLHLPRDAGSITHRQFADLPSFLRPGDRLVLNETSVLPARLEGERVATGGKWSGLFVSREADGSFWAMTKTKGRPDPGEQVRIVRDDDAATATLVEKKEALWRLTFDDGPLADELRRVGRPPLPPYILKARKADGQSADDPRDPERYQTVFADNNAAGSIAAPTAGLHFTDDVLQLLEQAGIGISRVTLHVGAGTFQPVSVERLDDHKMHAEWASVSANTAEEIAATREAGGRVVAVGTTSARTLETAARSGTVAAYEGETDLFIRPGFRFHAIDGLVTNFHLPKSTLVVLVAALAGRKRTLEAYEQAIAEQYRFYSYGDAMLIL